MADGDGQIGIAGQPLSQPLVVEVTDESGDPVSGVEVRWAAQGGGSVSAETGETDSNGRSSVQRILGSEPGEQTTIATAAGLQGSPVTFLATAVVGGEPGVSVVTQPPPSALSQEVWEPGHQPVVAVSDAGGSPMPGTQVTASIATGSGTLEGNATATTDAAGVASFPDLGIRGSGSHSLEFTAGSASATSSEITISPLPSEATRGAWGPVVDWDIVPLHMSLLPTGKILAWGKTDVPPDTMGMPRIWDPASGPPSAARMINVDTMLFCAGHTLLPDGRLMVSGGHLQDDHGIAVTNFFSADGAWQKGPNMAHGRWYPTTTVLSDGRVLTMAGRNQGNQVVTTPEIWENNRWVELTGAGTLLIPYYPRNFVAPDGRIFMAGERIMSRWFNVDGTGVGGGRGSWTNGPTHIYQFNRDYGTAAMYDAGKILYAGGGGHPTWGSPDPKASAPTATAEKIDLNQSSPQWTSAGSMSAPRRHLNSTVLPDGTVLITGGTRGSGFVNIDPGLAEKEAEVWDPKTGQWTTLAPNTRMRIYHSVSLLLPDGTVLHGSSGDAMAVQPGGGIVPVPPERNHEIFSPPYLFKGARPTITSAPASVGYNQTFSVSTPNAAQITDVRWIRLGSVTHAFDMSARANTLTFTSTATGVDVTAPDNPNLAPPGHYLLFILNRNGVPSEGQVIQVQ
jgi:galactose oxidase